MFKIFEINHRKITIDHIQALLIFLFLFPLFFQLSGSIYIDKGFNYDSQAKLLKLPLPMASVFCFIGIAFLLRLEKKHFCMGFVFSMFILMMFSTIVTTGNLNPAELAKFILLIQFVLPLFALVLGSLYLSPKSVYLRFESVTLYILLIVVPLEIIATIIRGKGLLSPYLYIFSLYQHLQYLPVIFVGFYFLTVTSFYENSRLKYLVLFLAPWMGIYIAASLSMMAIILAVASTLISYWFLNKKGKKGYVISLVFILWTSFAIYYPITQSTSTYALKYSQEVQTKEIQDKENAIQEESHTVKIMAILPNNLKERFPYWEYYGKGVFENRKTFLFGHENRPDRKIYPSAHNYYLDLIYHFGIISMIPFIYLISVTMRNSWRVIKAGLLTPNLAMLITLVVFFVFADNSLKVSFRQPYPGMVMFFVWGVLLTNLSKSESSRKYKHC